MHAYLVDSHVFVKDRSLAANKGAKKQLIGNYLADTMPVSYRAFKDILPGSLNPVYGMGAPLEVEEMHQWTSIGLERLAKAFRLRQIFDPLPFRTYGFGACARASSNQFEVLVQLMEYMLPQHLWTWVMLSYGATSFVLCSIDESYQPSASYLFDRVMYCLEKFTEMTPSDWTEEYLDACRLIERLLDIGLDPNARALSFTLHRSSGVSLRPSEQILKRHVLCEEATNWQRFLGTLWYLTIKYNESPDHYYGFDKVYAKFLALGNYFLADEADPHASIPLRLIFGPENRLPWTRDIATWRVGDENRCSLIMEQTAAAVFDEFTLRTGITSYAASHYFEPNKAEKRYVVREIVEGPQLELSDTAPRHVLRHFTAEQQQLLISAVKAFLKVLSREITMNLVAIVPQICSANSEHIIIEEGWPWWWRPSL